jgi:hypothetical protein
MARKSSARKRLTKRAASKPRRTGKKKAALKHALAVKTAKPRKPKFTKEFSDLDLESRRAGSPRHAEKKAAKRKKIGKPKFTETVSDLDLGD